MINQLMRWFAGYVKLWISNGKKDLALDYLISTQTPFYRLKQAEDGITLLLGRRYVKRLQAFLLCMSQDTCDYDVSEVFETRLQENNKGRMLHKQNRTNASYEDVTILGEETSDAPVAHDVVSHRRSGKKKRGKRIQTETCRVDEMALASMMQVRQAYGLPHLLHKYRARPGLFIGLFLVILLWAVSVQLVWEIRIDGLETLTREEVIQGLKKQGVAVGKSYRGLDLWQVQNEYLIADARLEWISINRRGTVITVQLKEQAHEDPVAEDQNIVSVLKAQSEGVVVRVESAQGDVLVHTGDVVQRDQVLISGLAEVSNGTFRASRAKGKVYADTYYPIRVEIPLHQTQKQYTGEVLQDNGIIFFGNNIKLFSNYGNLPALYDKIEDKEEYALPRGAVLPMSVYTVRYLPYREIEVELSTEQAYEAAITQMQVRMARELADAEIESVQTTWEVTQDVLVLHAQVECVRNIAQEQMITFSPDDTTQLP